MLLAVVALTAMFAIIKQMASELPFVVVALMRTSVALLVLAPWLVRQGWSGLATRRPGLHFLRSLLGIGAFVGVVFAIDRLLLSDLMVLSFTSPLWLILFSALFLGERIRRHRTLATIVGFFGVIMVVKPQAGIDPAMPVALLSAILAAGAMIALKRLSRTEPPDRIVFYFFLSGTLFLIGPAIAVWQTPSLAQSGWLAAIGLLGSFGQRWLTRAYEAADVTAVAPLDFLRIPIAAAFGFLLFDELPDAWSAAGSALIIAALVFVTRRAAERTPA